MAFHFVVLSRWADNSTPLHFSSPNSYKISWPNPVSSPFQRKLCPRPAYPCPSYELATGTQGSNFSPQNSCKNSDITKLPVPAYGRVWVLIAQLVSSCKWHGLASPTHVSMQDTRANVNHGGDEMGENDNDDVLSWKAVFVAVVSSESINSEKTNSTS